MTEKNSQRISKSANNRNRVRINRVGLLEGEDKHMAESDPLMRSYEFEADGELSADENEGKSAMSEENSDRNFYIRGTRASPDKT